MTTERACTRCHAEPAATGIEWCRGCRRRVDIDLGDLPAITDELTATMARLIGVTMGTPSQARETPLPYHLRAAEAIHGIRAYLVGWCRLIGDEVGAPLPADTIPGMARHLQRWLPHIAKHEAAGEMATELRDVTAAAWRAIDLDPDRTKVTVGPCPEQDEDGVPCPGQVVARFPLDPDARPSMRCGACSTTWPPESWASAGHRILARMGRRMPLDEAAVRGFMRLVG